jgi:hypothetical protein
MSEARGMACPQCNRSDATRRIADLPPDGPVRVTRPTPPIIPANPFGCLPFLLVTLGAITTAIAIGGLAQLTAQPASSPIGDLRPGDTAVFTGIMAFMLAFVGFFSILVWRQNRNGRAVTAKMVAWHEATERYAALSYCEHCHVAFLPGQTARVPADQADLLLYQ